MQVVLRTLLLTLLLAASAQATGIYFRAGSDVPHQPAPDPPANVHFSVGHPGQQYGFDLTGLMPFTAPRDWTVNAANAASFGFDWVGASAAFTDPTSNMEWTVGTGAALFGQGTTLQFPVPVDPTINIFYGSEHIENFVLDHIDASLVAYGFNGFEMDFRAYGDATIVPEPASLGLALLGLVALHAHGIKSGVLPGMVTPPMTSPPLTAPSAKGWA
jgi:hypothetical protein